MAVFKASRIVPFALFMMASTAFAQPAPENVPVAKLAIGTQLLSPPKTEYKVAPGDQPPPFYSFTFRGGARVADNEAINAAQANDPADPRYAFGNMTCMLTLERPSLPGTAEFTGRPRERLVENTYEDESTRAFYEITIYLESYHPRNEVTSDKIVCTRVGARITVADLRATLGTGMRVELSQDQAAALAAAQKLNGVLGKPVERSPESSSSKVEADAGAAKNAGGSSAPAPKKIVSQKTSTPR